MDWFTKQTFDKLNEQAIERLDEVIDSPSDRAQYRCVKDLPQRYITEELFLSMQSIFNDDSAISERASKVSQQFQETIDRLNISSSDEYYADGRRRPEFEPRAFMKASSAVLSDKFKEYLRANYEPNILASSPDRIGRVVAYEVHNKIQTNKQYQSCLVDEHYNILVDIVTNALTGQDVLQMSPHIIDIHWYDDYTNIWGVLDEHVADGWQGPVWQNVKERKNKNVTVIQDIKFATGEPVDIWDPAAGL